MNESQLLQLLEEMRKEGKIKEAILSCHVNAILRGEDVKRIYKYLSNDMYNLILLRCIAKQYLKLSRSCDLDISSIDKKLANDSMVVKMYKAAVLENTEFALKSFIKVCDLVFNYKE